MRMPVARRGGLPSRRVGGSRLLSSFFLSLFLAIRFPFLCFIENRPTSSVGLSLPPPFNRDTLRVMNLSRRTILSQVAQVEFKESTQVDEEEIMNQNCRKEEIVSRPVLHRVQDRDRINHRLSAALYSPHSEQKAKRRRRRQSRRE